MRAVVQRVRSASVSVAGEVVGAIDAGLLVYVGVAAGDTAADKAYIVTKIRELRIFADEAGRMNRSVVDSGGAVLLVSQFTLQGDARKGRRPSFDDAALADEARAAYESLLGDLTLSGLVVRAGVFQADMAVSSVNDGPVTILLDSKKTF